MSTISGTTPCCGYYWSNKTGDDMIGPIFWNEGNKAVQCHNCGQEFVLPEGVKNLRPRPASETQ